MYMYLGNNMLSVTKRESNTALCTIVVRQYCSESRFENFFKNPSNKTVANYVVYCEEQSSQHPESGQPFFFLITFL